MENFLISKILHPDIMNFSWNKSILVRLWVKVVVSQRWVQAEIIVHTLYFSFNLILVTLGHFKWHFLALLTISINTK